MNLSYQTVSRSFRTGMSALPRRCDARFVSSSGIFPLLLILLLASGGCATTQQFSSVSSLESEDERVEIVLMPLDVQLSLMTAGGMLEPRADWTRSARQHMLEAIRAQQQGRGANLVFYEKSEASAPLDQRLIEVERLHSAVGQAILQHKSIVPLPTKKDIFDWSLGPSVQSLKEKYAADYALFIHIRDSYSSAGRVLVQVAAAFLGVGVTGGQQAGFASLVDLRTGNIVWFNHLFAKSGDLRKEESARSMTSILLEGLPG